jgi:DNA-binding NtrC family response regulator
MDDDSAITNESEETKLLETLISLCDDLAWCRSANEESLFNLTNPLASSPRLVRLAEAFGLMLIKLEARSVELEDLVADLRARNAELDETRRQLARRNAFLQETLAGTWLQDPIVGESEALGQVMERAIAVSRYPINTMIIGPTGSGKEALAKFIFFNSPRRGGDFVAVNCSAIPETLFESEMFGIEKGVATGVDRRRGLIEAADGGTLFLDEVGDMSLACQAKLLRVVEERRVRRVGARVSKEVDLHIISATNSDLAQEVEAKRFREDLWYRLNVVELKLPPLKERGSDALLLAKHFLKLHAIRLGRPELSLGREAETVILNYSWPGNVRELANEMEKATALAVGPELKPRDLSEKLWAEVHLETPIALALNPLAPDPLIPKSLASGHFDPAQQAPSSLDLSRKKPLKALSDRAVIDALARHGGNKTQTAIELGISREGLRKKLARMAPGDVPGQK